MPRARETVSLSRYLLEWKRATVIFLLVLAALFTSGCDGGIFGTGDSNSDDVNVAATPPGNGNPMGSEEMPSEGQEASAEADVEATEPPPDGGIDDADAQIEEGDELPSPEQTPDAMANQPEVMIAFDNTLEGYPGVEPQLRFVNASGRTVRATLSRATGEAENIEIAPFSVTPHSILEIGETIIDLALADSVAPSVRIVASLGLSSVSTVLVQPADDESSVTALALETQSVTSDTSLAQLRLIAPVRDLPLSSGLWSLVPSGTNPGSVDATLEAIVDTTSDLSYTSITEGDYELRLDGQSVALPILTLNANTVTTLVLSREAGNVQLIEVLDSDIAGLELMKR